MNSPFSTQVYLNISTGESYDVALNLQEFDLNELFTTKINTKLRKNDLEHLKMSKAVLSNFNHVNFLSIVKFSFIALLCIGVSYLLISKVSPSLSKLRTRGIRVLQAEPPGERGHELLDTNPRGSIVTQDSSLSRF